MTIPQDLAAASLLLVAAMPALPGQAGSEPAEVALAGHVFDAEGAPVVGARVGLVGDAAVAATETDPDGAFELRGFGSVLLARADGSAVAVCAVAGLTDARSCRLELAPGGTVSGTVVDAEGSPVAGAHIGPWTVSAPFRNQVDLRGATWLAATTGADGRFSLPSFAVAGYRDHGSVQFVARTDAAAGELTVDLRTLVGHGDVVFDPIAIRPIVPIRGRLVSALDHGPVAAVPMSLWGGLSMAPRATTDRDGAFELDFVAGAEQLRIGVHPVAPYCEVALWHGAPAAWAALQARPLLTVPLPPLVLVRGQIVDSDDGMPPPFPMAVEASIDRDLDHGFRLQGRIACGNHGAQMRTIEHGRFVAMLPVGPLQLQISGPAGFDNRRKAYLAAHSLTVPQTGIGNVVLRVDKQPGLLVQMRPSDPAAWRRMRDTSTGSLIVEVHGDDGMQYADGADLWFYPVARWGDAIRVRVLWRPAGGAERLLLPMKRLVADRENWPLPLAIGP